MSSPAPRSPPRREINGGMAISLSLAVAVVAGAIGIYEKIPSEEKIENIVNDGVAPIEKAQTEGRLEVEKLSGIVNRQSDRLERLEQAVQAFAARFQKLEEEQRSRERE